MRHEPQEDIPGAVIRQDLQYPQLIQGARQAAPVVPLLLPGGGPQVGTSKHLEAAVSAQLMGNEFGTQSPTAPFGPVSSVNVKGGSLVHRKAFIGVVLKWFSKVSQGHLVMSADPFGFHKLG